MRKPLVRSHLAGSNYRVWYKQSRALLTVRKFTRANGMTSYDTNQGASEV